MARGQKANVGDTRVAQNGYHYTKTEDCWRLTHHIIAEQTLGRKIDTDSELVIFKDRNRRNLAPENIDVVPKGKSSHRRRLAQLEHRKEELEAEIAHVKQLIETQSSE